MIRALGWALRALLALVLIPTSLLMVVAAFLKGVIDGLEESQRPPAPPAIATFPLSDDDLKELFALHEQALERGDRPWH